MSTRATSALLLVASVGLSSGCDRLKRAVGLGDGGSYIADPQWHADSLLLASKPTLLFRVVDHQRGRVVVPFAVMDNGFRRLRMGERGWKALDLNYLQEGHTLDAVREGGVAGTVSLTRGFWTREGKLDTLPFIDCRVPAGLTDAPANLRFVASGYRPKPLPDRSISDAELSTALAKIPTLVAPTLGIPRSMLGRYKRDVHVMKTGLSEQPSIMVVYDDPEVVSDTVSLIGERPRQLIVILDKGVYGYRPSYNFTTVGSLVSRMTYLDYLDADGDGKAEIFFGIKSKQMGGALYDATVVLRAEGDGWRQFMSEAVRCEVSLR